MTKRNQPTKVVLTMRRKDIRKRKGIRYAEYYNMVEIQDELYRQGMMKKKFYHLMPIIASPQNIRLAYRNLKNNKGSNTPGVDGKTLLLISWMEQNANFREEAISLQAKSKAQQESIEALSAAYAQQRKLTHDFRAHLSTLDGMLMQQNRDINTIQTYIHSLQSKQTERILLVNTHHAALDALLNQKALVAKNRKIDIQFSVNDLSPIKIDMVDLTVVISNTLDNAIEACEKLPETDRQIYVQALLEEDELFYAVRNKSLPVNMVANQLPASTKENPSFHGYGLQNVHTTLEKYHTLYAMDYENGWFEFATELPNTLIS